MYISHLGLFRIHPGCYSLHPTHTHTNTLFYLTNLKLSTLDSSSLNTQFHTTIMSLDLVSVCQIGHLHLSSFCHNIHAPLIPPKKCRKADIHQHRCTFVGRLNFWSSSLLVVFIFGLLKGTYYTIIRNVFGMTINSNFAS